MDPACCRAWQHGVGCCDHGEDGALRDMSPVDRYLPFSLTLDTLVVYMVGLVTFLCIVVAWRALIDDDSRLARQRIIARRRDELRMAALEPKRRSTRRRALPLAALTRRWQLVQTAQAD